MPPKLLLIKPKTGKVGMEMPAGGQGMSDSGTVFELNRGKKPDYER